MAAPPPVPGRWALVVGDSSAARAPLEAAQRDVIASLERQYGYSADRIVEIYGAGATQAAIREQVASLRRRVRPADTIVVYVVLPIVERKGSVYFQPAGAKEDEVWTMFGQRELEDLIDSFQARTSFAMVNTCADRVAPNRVNQMRQSAITAAGASSMLTFCERSAPDKGARRFADALAALLRSPAADPKVRLTDVELAVRLREALPGMQVELRRQSGYADDGFAFVVERRRADVLLDQLRAAQTADEQIRALESLVPVVRSSNDAETREVVLKGIGEAARADTRPRLVRLRAISALGEIGLPGALADLTAIVGDSAADPQLRRAAVESLARIGTPETLAPIQKALQDQAAVVRVTAVRGVGNHKHLTRALPIVARVGDTDADVRMAALQILGILARPSPGSGNLIAPIAAAAKAAAHGALSDRSAIVRREAVNTLAALGADLARDSVAVALLTNDSDPTVRTTVALTLGREYRGSWSDPGASSGTVTQTLHTQRNPALVALIRAAGPSSPADVRAASLWSLGEIGDPKGRDVLIGALDDPDPRIREAAIEGLGKMRSTEAVPGIVAALDDDSARIRTTAARALGVIRDSRASEPLLARFKTEPDVYTRQAIEEALHRLPTPSMASIAAALRDRSPKVRREAVERLESATDPSAAQFVVEALGDEDFGVRNAALTILARKGTLWFDTVAGAADSPSPAVRFSVATALGEIATPQAGKVLLSRLPHEQNPLVRAQIADSLGSIKPPAPDIETALVATALDPDPMLRAAAASSLRSYSSARARETLQALAEDDAPEVRDSAIRSLRVVSR
jgi:HEAT repeat protein